MLIQTRTRGDDIAHADRPPGPPWQSLREGDGPGAYLSVYLSDPLARWPVRAITKPHDNKSDPNLETGTYGLFSTCQARMRESVVRNGVPFLFFVTSLREGGRALTGIYHVGWYAAGPDADYALAADMWRFVEPLVLENAPREISEILSLPRGYKGLTHEQTERLLAALESRSQRNRDYLAEIRRLEHLSLRHTGFRYPTWERVRGWAWGDAQTYLRAPEVGTAAAVPNTAPDDTWICVKCSEGSRSKARLKRCPKCGALATLRPSDWEV